MKLNRTYLFIAISSIALVIVLIIQVNWILQTAKIKEDFFNEKADMVLSKTIEALRSDKQACQSIGACVQPEDAPGTVANLGKSEVHKIDSLFTYYLRFYNFHIDYTFVVTKPEKFIHVNENNLILNSYYKPLEDRTNKSLANLKLIFPEKNQFIIAEMGTMFITSVVLILIVLVLFWRTILSLMKEKKISEHTTEFLNNMTHEFKTPLTNIALAGKMIQKDNSLGDKTKHYSGIILEENEKLRLQVEQVLSMTALERGEIPLHKSELHVNDLIQDALKCMSIQLEHKHGNIKLNLTAVHCVIMGNKTHLTNALHNLKTNLLFYMFFSLGKITIIFNLIVVSCNSVKVSTSPSITDNILISPHLQ